MRECVINQPAGLGDIIVCQKIAKHYYDQGYKIVWPIKDVYYDAVIKHLANDFIKVIKSEVAPLIVGRELNSFKELADIVDNMIDYGIFLPYFSHISV